jgi:protein-S-isoprenylcysteine O-methyltransferase Ste14
MIAIWQWSWPLSNFRFFGLAQAWARFRDRQPQPSTISVRYLYAIIRHPISPGLDHRAMADAAFDGRSCRLRHREIGLHPAATPFEEADLIDDLGDRYRDYRSQVPAFVPASTA